MVGMVLYALSPTISTSLSAKKPFCSILGRKVPNNGSWDYPFIHTPKDVQAKAAADHARAEKNVQRQEKIILKKNYYIVWATYTAKLF